jgi:predicted LPLAT superfamily acyltransferase
MLGGTGGHWPPTIPAWHNGLDLIRREVARMKLRKPLTLLLFAALPVCQAFAKPQPLAAVGQTKATAAAKKQTAKSDRLASDTIPQASEDADVERITVDELKAKIAKNEPVTIIDDRSQGSYESSETQIKGSIRITVDEIQSRLKEIPRDHEVVTYCT